MAECASLPAELHVESSPEAVIEQPARQFSLESDASSNTDAATQATTPPRISPQASTRSHPYRRSPAAAPSANTSTRSWSPPTRVHKAHARRALLCCDTCNYRHVPAVSPSTIAWHRNAAVEQTPGQGKCLSSFASVSELILRSLLM
jgi:hypothetical protein